MPEQVFRSRVIGLNYKIKKDHIGMTRVVFEDGINYRLFEIELLSGVDENMLKQIHTTKKVFAGEIVENIEHRRLEKWE